MTCALSGELGFFDNYIIPLAKKLKDCEVFGVDSDQCLVYAMKNREEWEARGEQALEEMVAGFKDFGKETAPEEGDDIGEIDEEEDELLIFKQTYAAPPLVCSSRWKNRISLSSEWWECDVGICLF